MKGNAVGMSRKMAREIAMKLSFAKLLGGEDEYHAILEQTDITEAPQVEDIAFSDSLLDGVEENEAELDALIEKHAIGWNIDRMPRIDLCILRIALYEMLYRNDITVSVSINEAVELAKRFGGEKSSIYINGLLGTVAKQLQS